MSQPETKYLTKANNILENFSNSINNNDPSGAFNSLYKLRLFHGRLIYKLNSSTKKSEKSKKYFYLSSLHSVINLIGEKIIESELNFNNHISSNNIDISSLKHIKQNKSAKSSDSNSSDSNSFDLDSSINTSRGSIDVTKTTDSLPLFEGEKSKEARKHNAVLNEMNKSQQVVEFNESIPSLLLFFNPRCPACVKTKPHWDSLTANFRKTFDNNKKGYLFNIMEIDLTDQTNENLASLFQIEYIPTIIMMESSKKPSAKIDKLEGAVDKEKLNSFIKAAYAKFSQ